MSLNFSPTSTPTTELAALEQLKINVQRFYHSSPFILIGSSSFRTTIKAWMSSNFAQLSLEPVQLAALVSGIITIDLHLEQCYDHSSTFIFDLIFILVGNKDMHKSLDEFEFGSDPSTGKGVSCPSGSENIVIPPANFVC